MLRTLRLRPVAAALAIRLRRSLGVIAGIGLTVSSTLGMGVQDAPAPPASPAAIPAARQASNVAIITIHDAITEVTAKSVMRRMKLAERAGADAIVYELNTPGGELGAVLAISDAIKSSPIPNTVAWVHSEAYSGGAVIALAAREMIVSDPASMGDAIPINISPLMGMRSMPAAERQKFLSPLISDLVDSARRRGYDEKLVQGIAALDVELWLIQNPQTGERLFIGRNEYRMLFGDPPPGEMPRIPSVPLTDSDEWTPGEDQAGAGVPDETDTPRQEAQQSIFNPEDGAPSVDDEDGDRRFIPAAPALEGIVPPLSLTVPSTRPVLTPADRGRWLPVEKVSDGAGVLVFKTSDMLRYGLAVQTVQNDEELKAFFGAQNLIRLDSTWSEGLVAFLTSIWVRGILVVVFIISLFLEMTSPGLTLPGAVAFVALALLLAPPMLIDLASWWEIAAIIAGIILIVLEIFVIPGFGIFGVIGVLALFGGLVGTFVPDGGLFPDSDAQREDLLYGVATTVLAVATSGFFMYLLSRHFGTLPLLNRLVLQTPVDDVPGDELLAAAAPALPGQLAVGQIGVAVTPLRPAGRVEFEDRFVDVVAEIGYIPAGATVRVTSTSEFRTTVEPVSLPPEPPAQEGAA